MMHTLKLTHIQVQSAPFFGTGKAEGDVVGDSITL